MGSWQHDAVQDSRAGGARGILGRWGMGCTGQVGHGVYWAGGARGVLGRWGTGCTGQVGHGVY